MDLSQEIWRSRSTEDDNGQIIDVRTQDEWDEGYIPGAILADIYIGNEFMNKVNSLDKSKNYYIYCKSGGRSFQACNIMKQMGFQHTYNLSGGIMNWSGEIVRSSI